MPSTIEEQIAALEKALASPESEVESGAHRVRYRSVEELLNAIAALRQAEQASTQGAPRRVVKVIASKDL